MVSVDKLNKMKEKKVKFRDPVVERVVDKFVSRSDVGYAKYGRTLDSERTGGHKDLPGYLNDIQEELMDAILYIQTAREELEGKSYCKCKSEKTLLEVIAPYYNSDATT